MLSYISERVLNLPSLSPTMALIVRLIFVAIVDALVLNLAFSLYAEGNWFLAVAFVLTGVVITVINLTPRLKPLRWISPALALIILVALYPIIYTVYISTTNFSDGHRYTQVEALDLLDDRRYLPEGEVNYYWSPYVNIDGEYALWLDSATSDQSFFAKVGEPLIPVTKFESGESPYTEGVRQFPDGLPAVFDDYAIAEGPAFFASMQALDPKSGTLKDLRFGDENSPIGINGANEAGNYLLRWIYDEDAEILTDEAEFVAFQAMVDEGQFMAADGSVAPYDYRVPYDGQDKRRTKAEAIELLEAERYLPDGAVNYDWTAYQNEAGDYALWLIRSSDGSIFFAESGQPLQSVDDMSEAPDTFGDYQKLNSGATMQALTDPALTETNFGDDLTPIYINQQGEAGNYKQRWVYDEELDSIFDLTLNKTYRPDRETGNFVAEDGTIAPLGYWVNIGLDNYTDAFTSSLVDGPLLQIFFWTISFAGLSVLTAFAMGLLMALILTDDVPFARIIRSILIIPWATPGMIGILIWRGMLNGQVGIIPSTMLDMFGWAPPFLTTPNWARFSILLVNLWFAYPYFMLISSGSLQSIPKSIYEAAEVDGANRWDKFWQLTLPLLLVSLGPLLIASFVFNFNNYLLIEALTGGGPQIQGTNAPTVGHTDNLITYTYRYAFSSGGTRDFGFASAIAVIIFFMVAMLTLLQFRLTKRWEEIGENV